MVSEEASAEGIFLLLLGRESRTEQRKKLVSEIDANADGDMRYAFYRKPQSPNLTHHYYAT